MNTQPNFFDTENIVQIADMPLWPKHQNIHPDLTPQDHFITRNGIRFAGYHMILDFWECAKLDCLETMESALRSAIEKAKATLLHIHLHHFTPNGGISGVAVLAESHISVHTWPEFGFAAFDIFMCGDAEPHKAIDVLRDVFQPGNYNVFELKRGQGGKA
jgi:S-adenosylmethionine decarboxylase